MEKKVILISKQSKETDLIIDKLSDNEYRPYLSKSIEGLGKNIIETKCNCVILDLDSINIDNQTIKEFTIHYPHVYFLCMSKDRFHPELKDAICYHIFACLTKPLDYEELLYWLRCIDDESDLHPSNKND